MKRGVVLIFVLVVLALLSLAALTFSELMFTERQASELAAQRVQATALAGSGVEMARWFLAQEQQVQEDDGGIYDNPERFRGVLLIEDEDARRRGRFTLVAPGMEDGRRGGVRFGLEDESTRLNLNTLLLADQRQPGAGREILMKLPGMTEPIADAILDWIDADDEPREFGAEIEYYSALDPPYATRNGPLATVEELLLVRDVTPELLFGVDANRNGYRDAREPDPQSFESVDNSDGAMDAGWAAYLTLYSLESNVQPDGSAKIDLNQSDMKALHDALVEVLSEEMATFIIAYRQNGPYTGTGTGVAVATGELDLTKSGGTQLSSVLDLVGARVRVTFKNDNRPTILDPAFPNVPGLMNAYLTTMMDCLTVNSAPVIPGRINVNQASRTVLLGIPGMTEDVVDQIIASRQCNPIDADPSRRHETWLLAEGIVDLNAMKALMPFVCGGGSVFRTQAIGYYDEGGPAARLEVFLDATKKPAAVLFWRDLAHLGRGYARETLGIAGGQ
ncbi:MAG: type II secretion system protein GspK [Planctomycetia bacterium]|nr:type II secretion system protein GspK [Planctomycetia bacterium]